MSKRRSVEQLDKFFTYVLGRRPDEFGLAPDENGFVKLKELLKAANEEGGFGHVTQNDINELLLSVPEPGIEVEEKLVRAVDREHLHLPSYVEEPPGQLYTAIRTRAWPTVKTKGLYPAENQPVVLSDDLEMAERLGRRIDPNPVILTVSTQLAEAEGVLFLSSGGAVYTCRFLPPDVFTGPALPKEKEEPAKKAPQKKKSPQTPGSFFLEPREELDPEEKRNRKRKKDPDWKKDRKKARRFKEDGGY